MNVTLFSNLIEKNINKILNKLFANYSHNVAFLRNAQLFFIQNIVVPENKSHVTEYRYQNMY